MEETENSENGPIPKEDSANLPVKACALCGCSTPAVRCDRCNSQTFCLSCDDMYHRHPKRKLHLRKAVDSIWSSGRSPRLRRRTDLPGDPSKIPIPPPRSRKKERHTIGGRIFSRPGFEMSGLGMKSITPPPKDMYSTPKQSKNTMEQTYENETAIVKSQSPNKPEEIYENDNVMQEENRATSAGLSQSPWNSPQSNISPIQVSIPSSTPEMLSNGQSFGFPPKPQSKSITDLPTAGGQHMYQHAPHPYPYMHPQMQPPYSHSMAHLNCAQCISSSWSNLMSPHPSPYFHPMSWGPMHPGIGRGATPTAAQGPMKHSHGDLGNYPDPNFPYPYPPGAPYYPNGVSAFDPNTLKDFSLPNHGSAKVRRSPSSTRSSRHAQSIEDLHSTAEAAAEPSVEPANIPAPKAQQDEAEEEMKAPVVSNEPWSCLHCTFINPPGIYICQVCCKTSYGNKPPDDSDDIRMESPVADHRNSESPMELVNMDAEIMTSKLSNLKRQKVNDDICQDSLETSLENEEAFKVCETENTTKSPMLTTETQTSTTTKSTDVQTQNLICKTMASSTDSIFPKQEMSVQTEIEMPGHCTVATDPMISSHSMESLMSGMSAPPYHNRRAGWGRGTSYSTQSLYDRGRSRSPLPRSASLYNEAHSLGRDSSLPPEEVLHSWNPAWLMSDPMYYKPHNMPESGHSLGKEDYFDGTWGSMDKLNRRVKTKHAKQQDSHHMPKFHRSLDDLKNVKHQEIIHSQELQFLQTVKEAERCGFSLEDLHVAYLHCGRENPVFWLEDNWSSMIKNVIALAAKYGEDNEENDVGTISLSEAKEALHIHRGDIWDAVTECIENRQRKILELTVRGNFTQKQISDALTHNEGNVELAYADLFRASNKRHKFILSPGLSEDSEDLSFSIQTEDGDILTHSKLGKLNVPPDSKSEKKKSDFLTKLSSIRQAQSERRKAREEKELERESTAQDLPVSPLEPSSRLIDERAILQSPETGEISEEGMLADEIPSSPMAEIEHLESVEEKMQSETISKPDTEVKKKDFEEDHLPVDYDANWGDSQGEWIEEYSDEQWDEENDGNWVSLEKKFHNMEKELAEEAMQMAALWEKEELEDDVFEQEPASVIETQIEESDKHKSEQEEKFQQWVKVNLAKDLSETEEEPVNEEVMSLEVKEPALSEDSELKMPLERNLALEEIQSSEQHLNIDLHDDNLSKSVEFDDSVISHSPLQHYPTAFDLSSKSFMESDWVEVKSDTNVQEEKQNELIESPPTADELTELENMLPDETYYKMQDEYEHEISDGEWEKVDIKDIELLKEASSLQEKEMLSHEEFKLPESVEKESEIEKMPVNKVDPHYENKHAENIVPKETENFEDNKPKPPLRRKSKLSALEIQMALMNQPTPIDTDVSDAPPAIPLKAKNKISEQTQLSDLYAVPDKKAKTKSPEPSQLSKISKIEKEIEHTSDKSEIVSEIVPPKPPRLAIPQTSNTFSKETSPVTSEFNESDSNCFADSESDPEIKMVRQKMHKKYSRHDFDDELENDQDIRKEKTVEKESINLGLSTHQTGMKLQEFDPELPIPIGTRGVQANDDILSPKAFREGSARPLQLFKSSKSESIESTEEKSNDFTSSPPLNKAVSKTISTSQDHSYYNTPSKSQIASQLQEQQSVENASGAISDKFMEAYNANYYNINDVNRNKLENDALTISNSNVSPAVISNLQSPKEELPLEEFPPSTTEPDVSNINEELLFTEMEATSAVADYFFGRYNEVTVAKPKKKVIVKIDKSGMPAMPKPMTASQVKSPTPPVSKSPSMEHSASPVLGVKAEPMETTEKETPKVTKPASPLIERKKVIVPEPVKVPVPTETLSFAEDYFFGSYNEIVPPKKIKTKNIALQQIPELPITKTNVPESSVFQGTLSSSDSIEDLQDFQDAQQFMSSMSGSLPSISEVGSMYEDAAENLSMISYDLEEPIWKDSKSDGKGKSVHFEEPQPPIAPPPRRNRGQHVSMSSTASGVGESKLFQTIENPQTIMLAKKKLQPTSEDFKIIQGHDPSEYSCDIPLLPCETPESLLSSEISVESYIDENYNSKKDLSCENVFYIENSKEFIDLPVPVFSSDVSDAPVSTQLFNSSSLQSNNNALESSSINFSDIENITRNLNSPEEITLDQDKNNTIIGYTLDDRDKTSLSEISSQNNKIPLETDQTISSKENATASLDDSYEDDSFQLVEQAQNVINDFCDLYLHAGFDTPANEVENYNVQNNNQDSTYDSEHEWKLNEERNNSLNATFIENPLYNISSETCSLNIINQDKLIINSEMISEKVSKDVISTEETNKTPIFDDPDEIIEDLSETKQEESNSQNICPSPDLDVYKIESDPIIDMKDLESVSDTVQPLTLLCQTAVKSLESSTYQTASKEELVKELKELLEEIDFSDSVSNEDVTKAEKDLSTYDLDSRSSSIQTIISTTLESNADANENIKDEETIDSMVMNEQDSNIDEVSDDKIKESDVFNVDQDIQESKIGNLLDVNEMEEYDDLNIEQRSLEQDRQESEIYEVSDDIQIEKSVVFNAEQEPLNQESDLEVNKFSILNKTEVEVEDNTRLNEQIEHIKCDAHTLKDFEIDSDVDHLHSSYETNKYEIECSSETENHLQVCSKNNEEEFENPEYVNTSSCEKPTSSRELSPIISENLLSSLSSEAIDSVEHYPQVNAEEENGEVICISSADEPIEEISIMSHFYEEWFDYVKPSDGTEVKKDLLAVYASYSQSESSATSSANVSVAGDFVEVNKEDIMQASVLNEIVLGDDLALSNTISCEAFIDLEEKENLMIDSQKYTEKLFEHTPERELFEEKLTDISNTYKALISESSLQHETDEVLNTENSFDSLSFVKEEIVVKDFSTEAISKQQSFRTSKSCQTDDSFEEDQFFDSFDDTFTIPSFIQLPFSKTTIAQPIKMEIGIQCSLISEDIAKSNEMTSKCFDVTSDLKLQSNSIQIQAVLSDDFNEEDSEMISAASSIQQGYQNALDKDIESSGSESLEDSDSDFFVEPHSSQDEADIGRKEKKTHKGLLFLDVDSDTGFSSGSDAGKYVTEEKQPHAGEKILISDKKDSSVRHTTPNKIVHDDTKLSSDSVTYHKESKQIISSNIAKVLKDNKSEVMSSETFSGENNSSNSVIVEEVQTNMSDSNAHKHSNSDNLSTSIEIEHEEQLKITMQESNTNIKTEKETLKQDNKATLSQGQCSLNESYIQELASMSNINNASDKSSISSSEKKQVSEIATEQELLSVTDSVTKLHSANEEQKKLKIDISPEDTDSFEILHGTLPKEIVERALTPVSEEKFPTYDSGVKFIDVEYVDAEQLEVTALEDDLTPTVEYFYGYLPTCSPPEVTYDRRDSYFEALEILDECVSDVQKSIFENQNIYKVTKKEKSNSLTPVHENDEIDEFCDASPLKTEDELADKFEEPLIEDILERTSFNEHENEVFVLSSEEIISKTSPCMSDNSTENIENLIFEDAIDDSRDMKPDILPDVDKKCKVSQKIIRKTDSTDQEKEDFVLSSDEMTDDIITILQESCLEDAEDLVYQDAIGDTIINKNICLPDVKSIRSGDSVPTDANNSVDQLAATEVQQISSQKSFADNNFSQHSDLNNLSENIQNNADKSIELSYETFDNEITHSEITEKNRIDEHVKNAIPLKILCENKLSKCKDESQLSPEFFDTESGNLKDDDKLAVEMLEASDDSKEKISEIPSVPSDIVRYLYYDDSIQFEDDSSSSQSTCSFQTFPISAQSEIANKDVMNSEAEYPKLLRESKALPLQNVDDTGKLESCSLIETPEVSSNIILRSDGSENRQTFKYIEPVFAEKAESVTSIAKIIDESPVLDVNLQVETSNSELESIQKSLGEVKQTLFSGEKDENLEISDESKDKIFEIPPEPSDSKHKISSEILPVSSYSRDKILSEIPQVSSDKISSEILPVPSDLKDKISSEITSVPSDSNDKITSEIPSVPSDIVRYLYYDDSIHFENDSSKSESTCSFETSPISAQLEMADKNKMSSGTEISELLKESSASFVQATSDLDKYELQEDSSNIILSSGMSENKPIEESNVTTSAERFDSVTSVPIFVDESLILDATSSVGVKQEFVSEEKEETPGVPLLVTEEEKPNALDIKIDNDEITDISTHFTMTDDSDKFSDIESDSSLTEDKCFFELDNLISDKESDLLTSQKNVDEHFIKQKEDISNEERGLSNSSALGECTKEAITEEKDVNGNITACEENLNLISLNKPLDIESIPKNQTSKCELIESGNLKSTTTGIKESSLEVLQPSMDSSQHDISIDDKSQCQNSEYFLLTDSISSNTSEFLSMYNDNISEIKTVSDTHKVIESSQEQPHQEISSQHIVLADPETPNVSTCKKYLSQCADKISLEKEADNILENEKVSNLQADSNNKIAFDSKDSKQQDIVKDNISVLNEKDSVNFKEKEVGDVDALKSFGHLPSMSEVMEVKSISNSCNETEMSFSVLKDNLHGEFKNEAEMKEKQSSGLDIDLVSTIQSEDCGGDNTFSFKSKMGDILGKELNVSDQDELKDEQVVDFKGVCTSEDKFLKDNENNKLPDIPFKEETSNFKDYSNESENGSLQNGDTSSCVDFKMKEMKNLNESSDTSKTNQSIVDFKGRGLQHIQEIIKTDSEQNNEESQITVDFKGITNNVFLNESDKANTNISSSIDDFKSDSRHGIASEKESTKFKQINKCNATVDFKGVSLDKNSCATETNNDTSLGSVDFKDESQQESVLKQFKEVSNIETSDNKNNLPIASSNLPSNDESNFVDFKGCISSIENLLKENVKEEKFTSVCSPTSDKNAIEMDKVDKDSEYNNDVNNFQGTLSSYVNNSFTSCYEDELSSYYSVLDNVDNTLTFTSDSEFTDSPSYVTLDDTDVTSYVSLEDTDVPSYVSFEDSDIPSYVTLEDTDINSEAEIDAYHGIDDFELDQFSLIKESTPTEELIDYNLFQANTADNRIQKDETKIISESKCFKLEIVPEKCASLIDLDKMQPVQQKIETVKSEVKDQEKPDEHKKKSDPVTNPPDSLQVDFKGSIHNNECLQTSSNFQIIENKPDVTPPHTTIPIRTHSDKDKDSYQIKDSSQIEFLSECHIEDQKQLETISHIEKVSVDIEKAEIHEIDSTQDFTDTASFTSITDEHETFSDSEVNSLIDNVVLDSFNDYKENLSSNLPDNDSEDNKLKIDSEPFMDNTSEVIAENNKETLADKTSDYLLSSSSVSKQMSHTSEFIKSDTDILQNIHDTTDMSDSLSAKQNLNEVIEEISNEFGDITTYESITDECEKLSESDLTNPIEDFPLSPECAGDIKATFNSELTSKDFKENQDTFLDSDVIEHSKDFHTNGNELSMQNDKKLLDIQFAGIPQNISEDISEDMLIEHFAEIKSLGEHLNVIESFATFEGDIAIEKIHEEANEASLRIEKTQDSDYWLEADTDYSISEFEDEALSLSNKEKQSKTSSAMISALSEQKNLLEVATQPSNDNTTEISVSSFFTDPEFSEHVSDTCADISLQGATTENSDKWSDIEGDGLIEDNDFNIEEFDINVCGSLNIEINKEQSLSLDECVTCPEVREQVIDSTDEDLKVHQSKELPINSAAKVQIPSYSITAHISQEIPNEAISSSTVSSSLSQLQPLSDVLASVSGLSDEEFTSVTPLDMTVEESDKWSDISDTSIEEMEEETASISLKTSSKDHIHDVLPSELQEVRGKNFTSTSKSYEGILPPKEKCIKNSTEELNTLSLQSTVEKDFTISNIINEEFKVIENIDSPIHSSNEIKSNTGIEKEEICCSKTPTQYSPEDLDEKEKLEDEYLEEMDEFPEEAHEYNEEIDEFAEEPREYIEETDEFNENFEDAEIELDENGYPVLHTPYIINDDEFVYPLQYTDWIEESFDLKEYGIDTVLSGSESDVHGYGIHEEFENIERMIDLNASNFDCALENIAEEDKTTESFKTLSNGTTSHLKVSDKEHDSWSTADAASIEDDEFPEHDDLLSRIDELLAEDFKDFHTEDHFKNESERFVLTPSNEFVEQSEPSNSNLFILESKMDEDSYQDDLLSKSPNAEDNLNESSALSDSIQLEKTFDAMNLSGRKSIINEKDALVTSEQIIKKKDETKDLSHNKHKPKKSVEDMSPSLNANFSSTREESALLKDQEENISKITSFQESCSTRCSEVDDIIDSNQLIKRNKAEDDSLLSEKNRSSKSIKDVAEVDKSMSESKKLKPHEEIVQVKNLKDNEIQAVVAQTAHPASVFPDDVKCAASGKAVIDINTSVESNIEMHSQEIDVKLEDITKPDIPCKQKHKKQTIDPDKSLSSSISSSEVSSIRTKDIEIQPNIPHKTEEDSSIPSIDTSDINKTPTYPRRRRRQPSTEAASLSSSSESLSSCESSSSKIESSNESDHKDTSDIPSVPVRRRRSVQSPAVGPRRRSSSDNSSASSTSKSSIHSKSSPAPDLTRKRLSIDERVAKLQSEGKCSNKETAFIAAKLIEMQFEEEDALLASKQCSSVYHAIKFLTQLCELCNCRFPINLMASMVDCTHRACKDCLKAHFTTLIYDRSIFNLLCPICHMPDITDQNIQEYFNHLDIMLRNILDINAYDLFQRKLRDEVLTKDPNFHWCSQCSSGFIASPRLKKLYCPDCSAITCASCHQTWELEHEGVHCERFQQWKDMHTPEPPPAGTVKFLTDRGITCPSCGLLYAQACGGCLMYKCSHCSHEFCGFCIRPFKRAKDCSEKNCLNSILHTHHPVNCLFFIRDKEISDIQMLLEEESVTYLTIPPKDQIVKSRCQVREQKLIHGIISEDRCGRDIVPYCAGLCKTHYYEYLTELLRKNKISPLSIMTSQDLQYMLRKSRVYVPEKIKGETSDEYYKRVLEAVTKTLT